MANYAIGDLQGCYKEFQDLLSQISFNEEEDKLWICGDLVNRGPESLQCLMHLHTIKNSCHIVLGNHDLHLIAVNQSVREVSNDDTFQDILDSSDKDFLIDWLKSLPFHNIKKVETEHGEKEFVMTHAGIPPHWSKDQLIEKSNELTRNLSSVNSNTFLKSIFGNEPNHPDRCKTIEDEQRLNINYLTRMRFYKSDGSLDLNYKGKIENAPKSLKPWFEYNLKIIGKNTHILLATGRH